MLEQKERNTPLLTQWNVIRPVFKALYNLTKKFHFFLFLFLQIVVQIKLLFFVSLKHAIMCSVCHVHLFLPTTIVPLFHSSQLSLSYLNVILLSRSWAYLTYLLSLFFVCLYYLFGLYYLIVFYINNFVYLLFAYLNYNFVKLSSLYF